MAKVGGSNTVLKTLASDFGSCDFFKNKNNIISADSHALKNTEWAAIAYLSQSMYGKYGNNFSGMDTVVYPNNSSKTSNYNKIVYTGRSSGSSVYNKNTSSNLFYGNGYSSTSTETYTSTYGFYTYDNIKSGYKSGSLYWKEEREIYKGTGASTTGNIYGVYDMVSYVSEKYIGHKVMSGDFSSNLRYENVYYGSGVLHCDNDKNSLCYGHGFKVDNIIGRNYGADASACDSSNCIRGGGSYLQESGIFTPGSRAYDPRSRLGIFAK